MRKPVTTISHPFSDRPEGGVSLRRAFTLIELMISIALVLLLILGVNQVFTYTTQAVGAGEAVNAGIRSSRAAQATFASDFAGIVPNGNGPNDAGSIIISSRAYYAYRNAKDQAAEGTPVSSTYPPAAYLDLKGDGIFGEAGVNGDTVYPSTYNFRNHRLDVLSFFSRGLFPRQTGNPGTFVDNMSSQEAWIWYGHLWLPDNTGAYSASTDPTSGSSAVNPNNYFGSQLALGRMAMLLTEKSTANTIVDQSYNQQWFVDRTAGPVAGDLTPLASYSTLNAFATTSTDPGTNGNAIYNSRVDLASTSIADFRQKVSTYLTPTYSHPGSNWAQLLTDGSLYRFQCNPFVSKPMQSIDMAHASPYFLSGCSQFTVEYAGDFLTQDNDPSNIPSTNVPRTRTNYGDVTGPGSDGQIDYYINTNGQKQIAWYGLPRSTSGQSTIEASNGDVVPLRDRFQHMYKADGTLLPAPYSNLPMGAAVFTAAANAGYPTFEKVGPTYSADYSIVGTNPLTANEANTGYTCAFGPNDPHPKLIRITMTLDDPTGRLPDGQTYQYVFALP